MTERGPPTCFGDTFTHVDVGRKDCTRKYGHSTIYNKETREIYFGQIKMWQNFHNFYVHKKMWFKILIILFLLYQRSFRLLQHFRDEGNPHAKCYQSAVNFFKYCKKQDNKISHVILHCEKMCKTESFFWIIFLFSQQSLQIFIRAFTNISNYSATKTNFIHFISFKLLNFEVKNLNKNIAKFQTIFP